MSEAQETTDWMNHVADRLESQQAEGRSAWDFIQSLDDKDLREFIGEVLLAMSQNTAYLAQEIWALQDEVKKIGGSK